MVLANGGSSYNEDGCHNRGGEDVAAPMALVTVALAAIDIAFFDACHLVAYAIACVVAIAIAFVSMQQRGQWRGQKEQRLQ
jgi:hypothetical protein